MSTAARFRSRIFRASEGPLVEPITPQSEHEVVEAVQAAIAEGRPLEIVGHGTKCGLGLPDRPARLLSTGGLSGVSMYEADELVLTAGAGTSLREIRNLLDQQGQELAFEPYDAHALYGGEAGGGTIGGVIAVNASGPRRIKAGAARDHLLGFRGVSGRAEVFKSGGRVMKNVTGYDLSKLITGSHGTLAVLTEVTVKVLPKAETEQTLIVRGLDEIDALSALRQASGSPHEVSSLAYVPEVASVTEIGGAAALLRIEGPENSVRKRRDDLMELISPLGAGFDTLDDLQSRALWAKLRDAVPVARDPNSIIWRVSVAPTDGPTILAAVRSAGIEPLSYFYDWAGGLIWVSLPDSLADSGAQTLRTAVNATGGHATLVRAPDQVRATVPVFHPQPDALAALTKRVKEAFDPVGVLNPRRMHPDY